MHYRSDYVSDILQRKHHKPIGFFVVSKIRHIHILSDEQFVKVPTEIIDGVEQELIDRIREYFPDSI